MKYSPFRRSEPIPKYRRNTIPKRFLFVDTETKSNPVPLLGDEQLLKLGVCIYVELDDKGYTTKRNVHTFYTALEFIDLMLSYERSKNRLIIVGHNVLFDIEVMNLPARFTELGLTHIYPIKNGKTFIWKVKSVKGSYLFIDTANYTATSLYKIGKDIGLPKMSIDFENCTDEELLSYCLNDTEICEKFILEYIRFLVDNNMGEFKLTIASQAFCTWRYRFMSTQPVIHLDDKVNEIEKNSYHGGRTECYRIGYYSGEKFFKLDINSQYPYAMTSTPMPFEKINHNTSPIYSVLLKHLRDNYVIVDCILKTDLPVFPIRAKITNSKDKTTLEIPTGIIDNYSGIKVIFPVGEYRTWLHSSEFRYALDNDLVKDIKGYVVYRADTLFKDYVDCLYDLKVKYQNEGNYSFRYVTKILQNALYGKFGQQFHETKLIANTGIFDIMIQRGHNADFNYDFTDINWFGNLYRAFSTGLSAYSFPAIAGAITANARMLIWNYTMIAGLKNVYYTDTDSLIVSQKGHSNLSPFLSSDKLGYLKLEGISDNVVLYGAKDYEFADKPTVKGIPSNSVEYETGQWGFLDFEGFLTWRNNGARHAPLTSYKEKQRKLIYDKGLVNSDGLIFPYPLVLSRFVYDYPLQSLVDLF